MIPYNYRDKKVVGVFVRFSLRRFTGEEYLKELKGDRC
jgi:hypothetical protein